MNAPSPSPSAPAAFDVARLRRDFPILHRQVHSRPLVYLDNAATTQKPESVIRALDDYYRTYNSNVHRGLHALSEKATAAYEGARRKVRDFLHAADDREIVFTRGTTEAINLVAAAWGGANLKAGDEVLITHLEHHSNIVPWQMICEKTGATLRVAPIDDRGAVDLEAFSALLGDRTRLVATAHISNALGTVNPVAEMTAKAHAAGALMLIDGAQAAPHVRLDVRAIGADFYAFSGHKVFGPTGIGALYGRLDLLEAMPPYQGGGDMIKSVSFEKTVYNDPPYRFEAGTPHIAGAIGLAAAIDYLAGIDFAAVGAHEKSLIARGTEALQTVPGLRLIGTAPHKTGVLSFVVEGVHPYDMAPLLDRRGVAVRTGHHCAEPVMKRFGVPATVRASVAMYNTPEEIDALAEAVRAAVELLA